MIFLVMKYPICIVLLCFEQVTFGGYPNTCEGNTLNQDQFFLCCWFHLGLGLTFAALLEFLVSNSCWKKTTPIDRKDIQDSVGLIVQIGRARDPTYSILFQLFGEIRSIGFAPMFCCMPPNKCHPWLARFDALENCNFWSLGRDNVWIWLDLWIYLCKCFPKIRGPRRLHLTHLVPGSR